MDCGTNMQKKTIIKTNLCLQINFTPTDCNIDRIYIENHKQFHSGKHHVGRHS